MVRGCVLYTERAEAAAVSNGSFTYHYPCSNQTALSVHHLCRYSKRGLKIKSAVSLLESGEQRNIKAINNYNNLHNVERNFPLHSLSSGEAMCKGHVR